MVVCPMRKILSKTLEAVCWVYDVFKVIVIAYLVWLLVYGILLAIVEQF